MTGILGKLAGIGSKIKALPGIAANMIKRAGSAVGNFVKNNAETIEKLAGGALGAGLSTYTGGAAYPLIHGANQLIQSLPDNAFTKHLKTISKSAALDFSPNEASNAITGGGTYRNGDPGKPQVHTMNSQTNAQTEYRSVLPSHFVQSTSSSTHSPMYYRPPRGESAAPKSKSRPESQKSSSKSQKSKSKGKKAKGKRQKGRRQMAY